MSTRSIKRVSGRFRAAIVAGFLSIQFVFIVGSAHGDNFPEDHYCNDNPFVPVCVNLASLKNPPYSKLGIFGRNVIAVPHRGLWGQGDGGVDSIPQGSIAAISAAIDYGYKYIEVDVMRTQDNQPIMFHDYPLYRLTSEKSVLKNTFNTTADYITDLFLRTRDGQLTSHKVVLLEDVVDLLDENSTEGVALMLDLKERTALFKNGECVQYCDEQYFKRVNWLLNLNAVLDAVPSNRYYLIPKTFLLPSEIIVGLSQTSPETGETRYAPGLGSTVFDKLLWVPVIVDKELEEVISIIDQWGPRHVAAFETNYKNPSDDLYNGFTHNGTFYNSILDYIKRETGLRGGYYSYEAESPEGAYSRWAIGEMNNSTNDHRANYYFALALSWGGFGVYTTDYPSAWNEIND